MININSDSERDDIINDLAPDLTPLLDVMFMLIIFLVLTTNTMQQVFDINLPKDKEEATTTLDSPEAITITIFAKQNLWAIDKRKFQNFEKFKKTIIDIKAINPNKDFIIFGDKTATIDKLMTLLTFMRKNGIETADIIME